MGDHSIPGLFRCGKVEACATTGSVRNVVIDIRIVVICTIMPCTCILLGLRSCRRSCILLG